jgi:hypothetical protein
MAASGQLGEDALISIDNVKWTGIVTVHKQLPLLICQA